jgi:hypothetical protein
LNTLSATTPTLKRRPERIAAGFSLLQSGVERCTSRDVSRGDFNEDGLVDDADLDSWHTGFGAESGAMHTHGGWHAHGSA